MSNNNDQKKEGGKITISSNSRYHEASMRFRDVWNEYQEKEGEVKFEIVNMVKILEKEGLNRTQAIQKIINDHSDLRGFSRATIYRELPAEMKKPDRQKELRESGQNEEDVYKGSDVSNETSENLNSTDTADDFKKIEYSSNPAEEEKEGESTTEGEPEVIYDPALLNKHIKEIAKLQEENTKLKIERTGSIGNKFDFKYDLEVKDQILPLIVTAFPDKKDGYVRLDKTRLKKD